MGKQYEIENKKFGKLKVIKRAENRNTRQSWWLCECDCGTQLEIRGLSLVSNHTKSCGCLLASKPSYNFKGYEDIGGKYWSQIKRHAKSRKINFEINIEEAWNIFIKQNKKCALSGLDIILTRNRETKNPKQTASLDRIDSKKHYTNDNIQWVHVDVNKIKNNLSEDRLFFLCKSIITNLKL